MASSTRSNEGRRPKPRVLQGILIFLLLAGLGAAAYVASQVRSASSLPPEPLPSSGQVNHARHEATRLRSLLSSPSASSRTTSLDENDLNVLLQIHEHSHRDLGIVQPHTTISPDNITMTGFATWRNELIPFTATLLPGIKNGSLHLTVQAVSAAGISLPGLIRGVLQDRFDRFAGQEARYPGRIHQVSLAEHQLILTIG